MKNKKITIDEMFDNINELSNIPHKISTLNMNINKYNKIKNMLGSLSVFLSYILITSLSILLPLYLFADKDNMTFFFILYSFVFIIFIPMLIFQSKEYNILHSINLEHQPSFFGKIRVKILSFLNKKRKNEDNFLLDYFYNVYGNINQKSINKINDFYSHLSDFEKKAIQLKLNSSANKLKCFRYFSYYWVYNYIEDSTKEELLKNKDKIFTIIDNINESKQKELINEFLNKTHNMKYNSKLLNNVEKIINNSNVDKKNISKNIKNI